MRANNPLILLTRIPRSDGLVTKINSPNYTERYVGAASVGGINKVPAKGTPKGRYAVV